MSQATGSHLTGTRRSSAPLSALDADAVRAAYRRWAGVYDNMFGLVSAWGRRRAVAEANACPAPGCWRSASAPASRCPLPAIEAHHRHRLSAHLLARARTRVREERLANVEALLEIDAEQTGFPDACFDTAVADVPWPRWCRIRAACCGDASDRTAGRTYPDGQSLRRRARPRWWVERSLAPASRALGWHPDFFFGALFGTTTSATRG